MAFCGVSKCPDRLQLFLETARSGIGEAGTNVIDTMEVSHVRELTDDVPKLAEIFYLYIFGSGGDRPFIVPVLRVIGEQEKEIEFIEALRQVVLDYENRRFDPEDSAALLEHVLGSPLCLEKVMAELQLDYGIERNEITMREVFEELISDARETINDAYENPGATGLTLGIGAGVGVVGGLLLGPELLVSGLLIGLVGWFAKENHDYVVARAEMKIAIDQAEYDRARQNVIGETADLSRATVSLATAGAGVAGSNLKGPIKELHRRARGRRGTRIPSAPPSTLVAKQQLGEVVPAGSPLARSADNFYSALGKLQEAYAARWRAFQLVDNSPDVEQRGYAQDVLDAAIRHADEVEQEVKAALRQIIGAEDQAIGGLFDDILRGAEPGVPIYPIAERDMGATVGFLADGLDMASRINFPRNLISYVETFRRRLELVMREHPEVNEGTAATIRRIGAFLEDVRELQASLETWANFPPPWNLF